VGDIFNYLATHPVGPATIPPAQKTYQSPNPVTLPTIAPTTTTTSTTTPTGTATGTG